MKKNSGLKGGGAVMADVWLRLLCSCGADPRREVVGEPGPEGN